MHFVQHRSPFARIALGFLALALTLATPAVQAAGVVGTGTAASCTEAALDTALTGGGAVTFNCGGPATIVLTATKTITVATSISGGATGMTLSGGGGSFRMFEVTGGGLSLDHITLDGAHDSASQAGAAAIHATADVTLTDSTVSGSQATNGGCPAIQQQTAGTLTLLRTTVVDTLNAAPAAGYAVCGSTGTTVTITDSTLTRNTGGALFISGTATLTNTTVAGNTPTGAGNISGLLAFGGTVTLRNSILANNQDSGGGSLGQCSNPVSGVITDGGGNFQFPGTSCGATIPSSDPLLGALANNGGPTQTIAIGPTSPAVDAGVLANCPATDQRGQVPVDGNLDGTVVCDSGAYERLPTVVQVPTLGRWGLATLLLALAGFALVRLRRVERSGARANWS